ncbi:SDR family oxidoreductase, partial [bacterium]|nr:SDR family oxidoreductase [bacterium]
GGLDVLVANAGVTGAGLAVGTSDEELRRLLDVNVEGAFRCARAAIRPMFRRGGGRVVFLGSVVGVTGNAGQAAYATTKAALTGLARSLARELAAKNILVNVVAPGLVDTGPGGMIDALPPDRRALVLESIPLGRAASPDEIAGVISFLSGADAGYITGQVFLVDGGLRM